jgi:hypothetical protein
MADTGAPWNLPYPLDTDLVRDGAQAIEDLALAVASGLSAADNAGIGSNVVQAVKTDTFTTTSTTDVLITGLAATITPSSNTSKVLVIGQVRYGQSAAAEQVSISIYRAGSRIGASAENLSVGSRPPTSTAVMEPTVVYLDSPATTSATTYDLRVRVGGGTATVNRRGSDTAATGTCTITVIEVAA